jgi:hypothetical protein
MHNKKEVSSTKKVGGFFNQVCAFQNQCIENNDITKILTI